MRSLRFALADALKVVLLTLLVPLALLASMSDLVEAQELKPATSVGIQKSETASPQALRTRKASIESELLQLRALLAEKKKALEEVKLMELEVSNPPDVPGGNALELVSRIARNAVSVPPTLTNTSSQTEINRVGDACVAAVKTILDERAKNPAPGPHQEINRVRTALEMDIEETSRKISSAEALVPYSSLGWRTEFRISSYVLGRSVNANQTSTRRPATVPQPGPGETSDATIAPARPASVAK